MVNNNSTAGKVFDIFNYIFLAIFATLTLIPFIYVVAASFATEGELATRTFFLFPRNPSIAAYKYILSNSTLTRSILVSIYITAIGTATNLFFTVTMAYPLSKKHLIGRGFLLNCILFCMLFSGGMIPTYLVVKSLKMLNSYSALILPGAISVFNLIVVKNFFQELPQELEEAASIDGCSSIGILWKIVLPLSAPVLATFGLFYAVGHWNAFFPSLLYLNDSKKWPLQVILRNIVMANQAAGDMSAFDPSFVKPPEQAIKMAVIVFGTVPILLVYPFLQKYFAKGVLIGAVKG